MKKYCTIKNNLGLITFIIFTLIIKSFSATDTTKGDTRLVPKEKKEKEDNEIKNKEKSSFKLYKNNKNEDNDCNFFGCFLKEFFKFIFIEPFKAFFRTDLQIENFSDKKIKWGLGASVLDFSLYPGASFSYSVKVSGDLLFLTNEYISIREHIGVHLSPFGSFLSDFERDVYVNGSIIGFEKDKGDYYYNISLPFITEIMFRPSGANSSFFFLLGIGPKYVYETFEGTREYSYEDSKVSITISDGNWIPSISLGLGKLVDLEGLVASFEIRYSLGINKNTKKVSLSGDNSKFSHCFTAIQYHLIF